MHLVAARTDRLAIDCRSKAMVKCSFERGWIALTAVELVLLLLSVSTDGFSTSCTRTRTRPTAHLKLSSSVSNNRNENAAEIFPGLSRKEIEAWMKSVPVYTITDSKNGGVIFLEGDGNTIGYFFLARQMAETTLSQLTESNVNGGKLALSSVNFGTLWFDLLHTDNDASGSPDKGQGIDSYTYRLVPDPRDLQGARTIQGDSVEQGQSQMSGRKQDTVAMGFQSTFNEIPVFMDLQMRFEEEDPTTSGSTVKRFPMYMGLKNLVETCQQFQKSSQESYEAAINVSDLKSLVRQMQQESTIDFRNSLLIPSTTPTQ